MAQLTTVYENDHFQITGVAVSRTGRMFVCFPFWSDRYLYAVAEVHEAGMTAFPNETWNQWDRRPKSAPDRFVCVQSVYVDARDRLWVLDPAAPMLSAAVPNGPKLVQVDLEGNDIERVIPFPADVAPPDSYLNDVRVDAERNLAYITDSGRGGIVVVDLRDGTARRVLDGHPSVMPEPGVKIVVNGRELVQFGKPVQFKSGGIALSPDGEFLYYKPISANMLYRVRTADMREPEAVARTMPTDGLWMDRQNRIYLSDLTNNAVARLLPDGSIERLVSDPQLQWPDSFAEGPDGAIYVTASHINEAPSYHHGKSTRRAPYAVFKIE